MIEAIAVHHAGEANSQLVVERQRSAKLHVIASAVGRSCLGITFWRVKVRTPCRDRDGTRRCREAPQQTLRAAQHFDLPDVVHGGVNGLRIGRNFVKIDLDRWSGTLIRIEGDAAQRGRIIPPGRVAQLKARCELRDVLDVEDLEFFELFASGHVYGHRNVLQLFRPARGGYDDVA